MDLIVLTFNDKWPDWERDGFPTRTAALTRALANDDRVRHTLVVNVPTSAFAAIRRTGSIPEPFSLERVGHHVWAIDHTRLMPRERHNPAALRINRALSDARLAAFVRESARHIGMGERVALHAGPLTTSLFGRLRERGNVYDAVDEWRVHPAFSTMRPTIEHAYAEIRSRADLVTAVSRPLAAVFEGGKPQVSVVHNAVGAEFCAPAQPRAVPAELAQEPRPWIGYTGALEERVDTRLLESLASSMPEATFFLAGPLTAPAHFASLRGLPNVRFLGAKNHVELIDYVAAFDACIMPHRDTPLTRMMDPIKVSEYIAAGKPVVMTAVGEWERFSAYAHVAVTRDEFRRELLLALKEPPPIPGQRQAWAVRNSWPHRASEVLDAIESAGLARRSRAHLPVSARVLSAGSVS
jgi:glycosyltransferase involved in cell wall biosynthesis